jgi:hypothetical protein
MSGEDIDHDTLEALESTNRNGSVPAYDEVVGWDGPNDELNPKNWTASRTWTHIVLVALFALVTYVCLTLSLLVQ